VGTAVLVIAEEASPPKLELTKTEDQRFAEAMGSLLKEGLTAKSRSSLSAAKALILSDDQRLIQQATVALLTSGGKEACGEAFDYCRAVSEKTGLKNRRGACARLDSLIQLAIHLGDPIGYAELCTSYLDSSNIRAKRLAVAYFTQVSLLLRLTLGDDLLLEASLWRRHRASAAEIKRLQKAWRPWLKSMDRTKLANGLRFFYLDPVSTKVKEVKRVPPPEGWRGPTQPDR